MPEPVLAFHPPSSLFPLIEVAEFDALPTLGGAARDRPHEGGRGDAEQ
jgi:hypothetical protein